MNVCEFVVFYTCLNKTIYFLSKDKQTSIHLEAKCKFEKTHAKFPLLFCQAYGSPPHPGRPQQQKQQKMTTMPTSTVTSTSTTIPK
jgi:hypothetical protein